MKKTQQQQQNNEERMWDWAKRSWITFYWIDKMRFVLFVQQYTNLLNEKKKTYQQHRVHSISTLMCSFVDSGAWHDMHGVLLFEICAFASCSFHFVLSFSALYMFISACSIRLFFFLELANTHTCTHARTAPHCLRPGKFQFYCTACNLILLVYIINRWMDGWPNG